MAFFTAPDRLPTRDRILSRITAVACIAHDAAQQPAVGRGYAVVPVQVELRQARNVNAEGLIGSESGSRRGFKP